MTTLFHETTRLCYVYLYAKVTHVSDRNIISRARAIEDGEAGFIISYNEAVIILFPRVWANADERRADNSSNNTYRCFNEHDNYFSRNSTRGREREKGCRAISTPFLRQCYPFGMFNVRKVLALV